MSDYSDMPDLEDVALEQDVILDYSCLPFGDPEADPTDDDIDRAADLVAQARTSIRTQAYADAIRHLTTAAVLHPGRAAVLGLRAEALLALGERGAAIRDAEHALSFAPHCVQALRALGRARAARGEWPAALEALSAAARADPDDEVVAVEAKAAAAKVAKIREGEREQKMQEAETTSVHVSTEQFNVPEGLKNPFNVLNEQSGASGPSSDFLDHLKKNDDIMRDAYDPEVQRMMSELQTHPEKIAEFSKNKRFMKVLETMLHAADAFSHK